MTKYGRVLLGLVALSLVALGATYPSQSSKTPTSGPLGYAESTIGAPRSPILVELAVTGVSEAEATATLSVSNLDASDAPGLNAAIVLPEGFTHVSGDVSWSGDLAGGGSIQIAAAVRAVSEGSWMITGTARYDVSGGDFFGGTDYQYVEVGAGPTITSVADAPPYDGLGKPAASVSEAEAEAASIG